MAAVARGPDLSAVLTDRHVASGAPEEGLKLARDVLREAPRWRWNEGAVAALDGLEATGAWDELRGVIPRLGDLRRGYPVLDALAERAHGRTLLAAGEVGEGIAALRRAIAAFDALPVPFEAARTREALADAVPAEARGFLEEAVGVYRKLRTTPHLERAELRLPSADRQGQLGPMVYAGPSSSGHCRALAIFFCALPAALESRG